MKSKLFSLLVTFLIVCSVQATELDRVFDSLEPGQHAMMDVPSWETLNMQYSLMYWSDSGWYDPVHNRIVWIGAPGTCCEPIAEACFQRIVYDVASNHVTMAPMKFVDDAGIESGICGHGHSFDGNTGNPTTGMHYISVGRVGVFEEQHDGRYKKLPKMPWWSTHPMASSLAWHEAANALVLAGTTNQLAVYRKEQDPPWTRIPVPLEAQWVKYNTSATYLPSEKSVYFGKGQKNYFVNEQLALVQLPDLPPEVTMTIPGNPGELKGAWHAFDPVSQHMILTVRDDRTWWERMDDGTFVPLPPKNDLFPHTERRMFHASIPGKGIVYFSRYYDNPTQRDVWAYKHAKPVEPPPVDNLAAACNGAYLCERYDGPTPVRGVLKPGGNGVTPVIENGSLVITIPEYSGTDPGGHHLVPLPESDFLAVYYQQMKDENSAVLEGVKDSIMWAGQASYTDNQWVQVTRISPDPDVGPVIGTYIAGGSPSMLPLANHNYQLQWNDFPDCTYHAIAREPKDDSGCLKKQANIEDEYYCEVHKDLRDGIADPNNGYVCWNRREGGPWKQYVNYDVTNYWDAVPFTSWMSTQYMTKGDITVWKPEGKTYFRHLIIRTEPFMDKL